MTLLLGLAFDHVDSRVLGFNRILSATAVLIAWNAG